MICLEEIQGFSKLNRQQRHQKLLDWGLLSPEDINHLKQDSPVPCNLAEHFIENVIGFFQIPLGVVPYFVIDGKSYIVPMAVEETSIIAAASKTAKWVRENGSITTKCLGHGVIGQMQISKIKNINNLKRLLKKHKAELLKKANQLTLRLQQRGGGFYDIVLRTIPRKTNSKQGLQQGLHQSLEQDEALMGVIHLYADTKDAMGANIMNQVCEGLKPYVEKITGEKITMCIVSNLSDTKCIEATVLLEGIDSQLGDQIEEASYFAQVDPYRAATNNKGVLNGIDPILIATGNDWRAVEAGVHAFACRKGRYTSITQWKVESGCLKGVLKAPMSIGIVGGVTCSHPTAQLCLKMLKVQSAEELARVVTAVGLVQNLGALRALSTVGVVRGHINLHIANLAITAGATEDEVPIVQKELQSQLNHQKKISGSDVESILTNLRTRNQKQKLSYEATF